MKSLSVFLLLLLIWGVCLSKTTIKIVTYNLLYYPGSTWARVTYLKKIFQHLEPDIILVNELESDSGASYILKNALNTDGKTIYKRADFTNGKDSDNMLFYNKHIFTLLYIKTISTSLRYLNYYQLMLNDTTLGINKDTTFIGLFSVHLKSSQGSSNEKTRWEEATELRKFADNYTRGKNLFIGGDFNLYSSNEPAYKLLTDSGKYLFNDVLNIPGDWNGNSQFSKIHTQSTRSTDIGDGGAIGGLDDRFDFILCTDDVLNGTNKIKYVKDSYISFGNDGFHFNKSINDLPKQTGLDTSIISALYYMSDHLPVYMEVETDVPLPPSAGFVSNLMVVHPHYINYLNNNHELVLQFNDLNPGIFNLFLYNLSGQKIDQKIFVNDNNSKSILFKFTINSNGIYSFVLRSENKLFHGKLIFVQD